MKINILFIEIFLGFCAVLRPLFGSRGICIFPEETCQQYVLNIFKNKLFFCALFLSIKRILFCNPVNGLLRNFKKNATQYH